MTEHVSDPERTPQVFVVVHIKVHPERVERAVAAFQRAAAATREEPGCLRYELIRKLDAPGEYALLEEWRSRAALDEHLAQPYIRALGAELPELLAAPLEVNFFGPLAAASE